jgi:hypothetical protein
MNIFLLTGILIKSSIFGNTITIDRYFEAFTKAESCIEQKEKLVKIAKKKYDMNKSKIKCEILILREGRK